MGGLTWEASHGRPPLHIHTVWILQLWLWLVPRCLSCLPSASNASLPLCSMPGTLHEEALQETSEIDLARTLLHYHTLELCRVRFGRTSAKGGPARGAVQTCSTAVPAGTPGALHVGVLRETREGHSARTTYSVACRYRFSGLAPPSAAACPYASGPGRSRGKNVSGWLRLGCTRDLMPDPLPAHARI